MSIKAAMRRCSRYKTPQFIMTAAQARRPTARSAIKIASPAAADLIRMFFQRNPKSSRGELTMVGKLVAEFSATAAEMSPAARKRLIARKERFKKRIVKLPRSQKQW